MTSLEYPGKPETILEFKSTVHKKDFQFNISILENILLHEDVYQRKIAVVSIMGAFRKGKSFLLDYFLRYMYTTYKSVNSKTNPLRAGLYDSWIGDINEPLQGFSWRSGSERNTTGIVVWSDVFLYDSEDGEKIAIILMDTQGLFDHRSTAADNSRIFSLSTLMSSMQIFNLFTQIQEDHLQYLQFATEYAKFATSNTENNKAKPFQNLLFLIRDWGNPDEYAFGLKGGLTYLEKILKVEDGQLPELKSLREYIHSSFENITCFLMPHPGKVVASSSKFDGHWGKIDEEFVDELKTLATTLLSPTKLYIKKINDQSLQAAELYTYMTKYVMLFKSDEVPEPKSIYQTTVEHQMQILIYKCLTQYDQYTNLTAETLNEKSQISVMHQNGKAESLTRFAKEKKMGTPEDNLKYGVELANKIEKSYQIWKPNVERMVNFKIQIAEERKKIDEAKKLAEEATEKANIAQQSVEEAKVLVEQSKKESLEAQSLAKKAMNDAKAEREDARKREQAAKERADKIAADRSKEIELAEKQFQMTQTAMEDARKQTNDLATLVSQQSQQIQDLMNRPQPKGGCVIL